MKDEEFNKEWNELVNISLISISSITAYDELVADGIYNTIKNIFGNVLLKLRKDKIYKRVELETIYFLIRSDIYYIDDITNNSTIEAMSLTFETIHNIFEELILLNEDYEFYETCANLQNFRELWFEKSKVKMIIMNER